MAPVSNMALKAPLRAIALRNLDNSSLSLSASGGAFPVLARAVIEQGGVVFGASLLEDGKVKHVCAQTLDELIPIQGSKYVCSDVANTFSTCAEFLQSGVKVLYSGTPCQIAGLRANLARRFGGEAGFDGLICVDLICHGTPKQTLFQSYLKWLAAKHSADDGIHGYEFRNKRMGWGLYYCYHYYRAGKKYEVLGQAGDDPYYSAFAKGIIYRKCCYRCPFARIERIGDFTIGDYWGLEKYHPDFFDTRGVSAVLINSAKADDFFMTLCSEKCAWIETRVENIVAQNGNLTGPTKRSEEQAKLANDVEKAVAAGDYEKAFGQLLKPHLSVKAKVRRALPWRVVRALHALRRR